MTTRDRLVATLAEAERRVAVAPPYSTDRLTAEWDRIAARHALQAHDSPHTEAFRYEPFVPFTNAPEETQDRPEGAEDVSYPRRRKGDR